MRAKVLGSARVSKCWLRHSAATNFPLPPDKLVLAADYKVRDGRMPSPALCKRALPRIILRAMVHAAA
ncbi:MAG: hypothetical protein DME52_02280 [Verrucomicrobia bacterium]|nr:MAG: hypothetical protein DME52_02280 [Verrucomicrobiota bacterium]